MAKPFKFKVDFSSILKGIGLQKAFNKGVKQSESLWKSIASWNKKYESQQKAINDAVAKHSLLMKQLDNEGASPLRKKIADISGKLKLMGVGFKNPFPLLIKSVGLLKVALIAIGKVAWIGLLTAAVAIFAKMWQMNIGGIQKSFFKVVGVFKNGVGQIMKSFVKFTQQVAPIVEPFFEAMADMLIPVIDKVMKLVAGFIEGGKAASMFEEIFVPIMDAILGLMNTIIPIWSSLVDKIMAAGPTGENSFGKLLKSIGKVLVPIFKLIRAIFKVLDSFYLFDAVIFIVKLLAEGLTVVFDLLGWIVEKVVDAVNWFAKLAFWKGKAEEGTEEETAAEEKRAQVIMKTAASKEEAVRRTEIQNTRTNTINNNNVVNVHSSGPITEKSAPMIGDTLARSISLDMGRL